MVSELFRKTNEFLEDSLNFSEGFCTSVGPQYQFLSMNCCYSIAYNPVHTYNLRAGWLFDTPLSGVRINTGKKLMINNTIPDRLQSYHLRVTPIDCDGTYWYF